MENKTIYFLSLLGFYNFAIFTRWWRHAVSQVFPDANVLVWLGVWAPLRTRQCHATLVGLSEPRHPSYSERWARSPCQRPHREGAFKTVGPVYIFGIKPIYTLMVSLPLRRTARSNDVLPLSAIIGRYVYWSHCIVAIFGCSLGFML